MRLTVLSLLLSTVLAAPFIASSSPQESFANEIDEFGDSEKTLLSEPPTSHGVHHPAGTVIRVDLESLPTSLDDDDTDVPESPTALERLIDETQINLDVLQGQKKWLTALLEVQEAKLKKLAAADPHTDPATLEAAKPVYVQDVFDAMDGGNVIEPEGDEAAFFSDEDLNNIIVILFCGTVALLFLSLLGLWVLYRTLAQRRRRHSSRQAAKIGRHRRRSFGRCSQRKHARPEQSLSLFEQGHVSRRAFHQDKALLSEKSFLVSTRFDEKARSQSDRATSVEDELTGLREVVGVVADIVTAEESRRAPGGNAHEDALPRYEQSRNGRPPSYKEQASDDEETC